MYIDLYKLSWGHDSNGYNSTLLSMLSAHNYLPKPIGRT